MYSHSKWTFPNQQLLALNSDTCSVRIAMKMLRVSLSYEIFDLYNEMK